MALTKVKGSGLATGAATASLVGIDDNATSTAITIDANENVGIGSAPSAWTTFDGALQISGASFGGLGVNNTALTSNLYYNAGWKYYGAGSASLYQQNAGQHTFSLAGSGTAGSAASLTGAMTITADGRGLSQFTAKAWVNFNGTGTVAIRDSHNVSSITDNAAGIYQPNFTNALSNSNYSAVVTTGWGGDADAADSLATSNCRVLTGYVNSLGGGAQTADDAQVSLQVFGD